MRTAIYARYSSDLQAAASIEDQVRQCKARIKAEGWLFTAAYTDRAVSGATSLRSGYQAMLADARAGAFDMVVAEALDPCPATRKTSLPFTSSSVSAACRS